MSQFIKRTKPLTVRQMRSMLRMSCRHQSRDISPSSAATSTAKSERQRNSLVAATNVRSMSAAAAPAVNVTKAEAKQRFHDPTPSMPQKHEYSP